MKKLFLIVLAGATFCVASSFARQREPSNEVTVSSWRQFEKVTNKFRYAVVMFYYNHSQMHEDEQLQGDIDELKRMFRAVSREQRYENADVVFLRINLAWEGAGKISNAFDITNATIPSFLLIKNGDAVRVSFNKPIMLIGYVDRDQLIAFIDKHWHDELIDEAERVEDEKERRREEQRTYWYYDPWPYYYGWGWPWYGRRWGWYW